MQKKIFLQKNTRMSSKGSGPSYAKTMLFAAIGLIALVVITPLIMSQKGNHDAGKRLGSDRGLILKEIPKAPEGSRDQESRASGMDGSLPKDLHSSESGRIPTAESSQPAPAAPSEKSVDSSFKDGKPPQVWVDVPRPQDAPAKSAAADPTAAPGAPEPAKPAKEPTTTATTTAPVKPQQPPVAAAKDGTGTAVKADQKSKVASVGPATTEKKALNPEKKVKPSATDSSTAGSQAGTTGTQAAKQSAATDQAKAASPAGRQGYSVQVGSFKDRQNAQEMQQALERRGYQVVLKPTNHPTLGQLYVVQLKPVEDEGKANTLLEQIKHEERVKPMIIRAPQE